MTRPGSPLRPPSDEARRNRTGNDAESSFSKYPYKTDPLPDGLQTHGEVIRDLRRLLGKTSGYHQVYGRDDEGYDETVTIFNGAIKSAATAVVQPTNAEQVSKTVLYCREHDLHLSVKGGGTGVHGQSIAGHIILDLCLMKEITVSLPTTSAMTLHESFSQLHLSQRPIESPQAQPVYLYKRSAETAGSSDGKRKLQAIRTGSPRDEDMSDSSGHPSRTGSEGSGSRSRSNPESTPPTSVTDSATFSSPQSSSMPRPIITTNRTTYINPSPSSATSYLPPFGSYPTLDPQSRSPSSSHTLVTFGAGVGSKLLDSTTARSPYGSFYVPTSAFPVGAGQFLLGGFGFIGRKYGLAMDNLVEAEVVLADGRIVWVGADGMHAGDWREGEDPQEVWWGLRGAGPSLGVVTRFRAKGYYVPSVYAGNFIYVFDRTTAPSLLRHVRDCIKGSSRSLYANIIMTAGPPGAPAIIVIQLCYAGPRSEGEQYVQAISAWEGGRCLFQDFSERSFERQQVAVEDVLKGGFGKKWYIKSDMISSLPDDVIDQTCERFHAIPDGCTWLFEFTGGGAPGDVTDTCYPHEHRQAMFTVAALHQWAHNEPPALDTKCVTTAEEWITEVIKPYSTGGPLPCFLQSSTPEDVKRVYGTSYPRLLALKDKIDPEGFFCHSMFPRPNAPDEWDQLPPVTQARVRKAKELKHVEGGKGKGKVASLDVKEDFDALGRTSDERGS